MKVLEALDKPNDITNHSYNLSRILKVVFKFDGNHSSNQVW